MRKGGERDSELLEGKVTDGFGVFLDNFSKLFNSICHKIPKMFIVVCDSIHYIADKIGKKNPTTFS